MIYKAPTSIKNQARKGSHIYARGPVPSVRPLAETFFCTQREYFIISNSIFSFNFQALVLYNILGGHKITLEVPVPPVPLAKKLYQIEYFTISNCILNFNFLALVVSEILEGSQIYTGATHPGRPLAEKFPYAKRVLGNV